MGKDQLEAYQLLKKIRDQKPVVHHLTNWVTIYDCAQVVKVLGGSPVMAHAPEEVEEMTGIASALVLNIGTLTVDFVASMKKAAQAANKKGIPVVLDVCGVGATKLRDQKCLELLETARIAIIKGNASEIARLSGQTVQTKGVDSGDVQGDLQKLAAGFAQRYGNTVVVTGETDIITDGRRTFKIKNGHPVMTQIVGTGCMAASVIGTFAAVHSDLSEAAVAGLVCYEVAAELAAVKSQGPGTFKEQLFDALSFLDKATISKRQRVERK